ncbi:hypothetical protein B9Z55_023099 [Caenorhabditis nigoni]|uniref:Intein C-terminal splicing domain-containing protein n=1 Tax=Caenorhabditis nigoni TaxID=1611254 RepID=A0A2G5SNT1_9PELO|nr:hypothetical protein B9Z55_023099 [Caenorhabditis nigoni]
MLKFFVFFLFCTSCLIQVETLTKFRVGGTLTCDYNKKFEYLVTLFEDDILYDEPMGIGSTGHGRGSSSFNVQGQDTDDGWVILWVLLDNTFEVYLKIAHNCNKYDNLWQTYIYYMGDFPIKDGEVYNRSYNINVTDAGVKGRTKRELIESGEFPEFHNKDSDLAFPLK